MSFRIKIVAYTLIALFSKLTFANQISCVTGDPKDLSLAQIFNDPKNPDNAPIQLWRNSKPLVSDGIKQICRDCLKDYLKDIADLEKKLRRNWSGQAPIRDECVLAAMSTIDGGVMKVRTTHSPRAKSLPSANCTRGKKVVTCPTEAYVCKNTGQPQKIRPGSAPCVTEEMGKYVAWLLNQGMNCLAPSEDDPIDARTIFRKLNNESQFGFFVTNVNGTGLHQIVRIMSKEMLAPERGYDPVIRPLKDLLSNKDPSTSRRRKACEPFRKAILETKPQSIKESLNLKPCDLLQPGVGLSRSILLGIGNYVYVSYHYRVSGENVSANSLVSQLGFNPAKDASARELRDQIALAYYSAAGIRGGLATFERVATALGCESKNRSRCNSSQFLSSYKTALSQYYVGRKNQKKLPDYLNKINQRYKGLLEIMHKNGELEGETVPQDPKGDLCIS